MFRKLLPADRWCIFFLLLLLGGRLPVTASQSDSLTEVIKSARGNNMYRELVNLAGLYETENKWIKAGKTYQEALSALTSETQTDLLQDSLETRIILRYCNVLLFHAASYDQSLKLLLRALELSEKNHDSAMVTETSIYLGFNYRFLKRYRDAVKFLDQAIRMAKFTGNNVGLLSAMNEKANNLYYLGDTDRSVNLRMEALELAQKTGNRFHEDFICHDLAILYFDKGDYRKALNYFMRSYEYCLDSTDRRQVAITAVNVASAYLNMKIFDSALLYIRKADTLVKDNSLYYERSLVYEILAQYFEETGNWEKAFQYLTLFTRLNDSIFNIEKESHIAELTEKYESDKKEQENKTLRLQNRNTRITAITVTSFVLLIIIILLRNNRKRRLANRELEKRNEVISRQKENLSIAFDMQRRREQELRDANASKDMFFSIIAHDLKNPFSALLGFSGLLREKFESFPPEELRNIFRHMNDASENIYLLLENLLAWSRIQTGRMEVNPRHFDISDMIHDQVASFESHTKDKNITVSVETGNPIKVYSDPAMIAFVIRNLLSNAIKYNNRNGSILIRSEQTSTRVTISIIDNGVGIPIQDIDRLFRIDGRLKTPGTEKETGTGLGLIVSREYIEKNNGTIHAKSDPGEGSSFYFTLPVSNGF